MYDLSDIAVDAEVNAGTNILIAGPPMTGKRRLAMDVLSRGAKQGDGSIIVTTKDSGRKILDEFTDTVGDDRDANVAVVDCVTKQRGIGSVTDDPRIKYASSPVDMTGIGIKLSEFLQEFYEERNCRRNRVLLHSVSTLLLYSDLQTVFRFLHVFTGRIQSADGLGLYIIDSTAHDDQTMNTMKQLFDGLVEIDETDAAEPDIRTAGITQ